MHGHLAPSGCRSSSKASNSAAPPPAERAVMSAPLGVAAPTGNGRRNRAACRCRTMSRSLRQPERNVEAAMTTGWKLAAMSRIALHVRALKDHGERDRSGKPGTGLGDH